MQIKEEQNNFFLLNIFLVVIGMTHYAQINHAAKQGDIIEIGCIREPDEVPEDGFSTVYLAQYAKDNNRNFISWDTNLQNVRMARTALGSRDLNPLSVIKGDGEEALKATPHNEIAFLYLDSHRNPAFTLNQYKAANLLPGAIVCVDDAYHYDEGFKFGKATFLKQLFEQKAINHQLVPTFSNGAYQNYMLVAQIVDGKGPGVY